MSKVRINECRDETQGGEIQSKDSLNVRWDEDYEAELQE